MIILSIGTYFVFKLNKKQKAKSLLFCSEYKLKTQSEIKL